jgi:hypothetical protein
MATFGTFVAGQVLTAAELNDAGTWQDYTPTWTQSATITKTVNWARYMQFNKFVCVQVKMTASSAGTANNKILVGLPVNASSNNYLMGSFTYFDESLTIDQILFSDVIYESTSTVSFFPVLSASSGTFGIRNGVSSASNTNKGIRFGQDYTNAFAENFTGLTVASNDEIYIQLMYEAA